MKKGVLLYDEKDYIGNKWFASQFIELGLSMNLDIELVFTGSLNSYDLKNKFIINRARDSDLIAGLEKKNIHVFNNSMVSYVGNNKMYGMEYAKKLGIKHVSAYSAKKVCEKDSNLTFPLVVKSLNGHGGYEVHLAENKEHVIKIIGTRSINDFLVQDFLPHCTDIRVYTLGEKIIGATQRIPHDDFRSNINQGGKVESFILPKEIKNLSIEIASSLNADLIGIDFLKHNDVYYFNEIEDVVGTRGLYKTANIDVVSLYLKHIKEKLFFR